MARIEFLKSLFHPHPGAANEFAGLRPDGLEAESRPSACSPGDSGDSLAPSWESAWIDLGGEG